MSDVELSRTENRKFTHNVNKSESRSRRRRHRPPETAQLHLRCTQLLMMLGVRRKCNAQRYPGFVGVKKTPVDPLVANISSKTQLKLVIELALPAAFYRRESMGPLTAAPCNTTTATKL
ncbi:unnamed protein product, partial [Nesidiocoris tenuis]